MFSVSTDYFSFQKPIYVDSSNTDSLRRAMLTQRNDFESHPRRCVPGAVPFYWK